MSRPRLTDSSPILTAGPGRLTALLLGAALLTAPAAAQAVDTFYNRNVPTECEAKMKAFVAAGHRIVCVAFPPAGGNRWTIVTDKSFFNRNVPQECHDKMNEFVKAGQKIRCVAYPPAGGNSWSVVGDKTFFNRNVAQECHDKMNQFHLGGAKVSWVAFPPAGGNSWTVITEKGSFFNRSVPQECHDKMNELTKASQTVVCVAYPPAGGNRWTVITDSGFFNRATPTHFHRVTRAMIRFPGGPLHMAAFTPAGDGFTIVSEAHPDGIPSTISVGNEYFSLEKFADNLRTQLNGKGVKWAFAIRHGAATRSFASGVKRSGNNTPAQDFSIYDRFNPASVSKTVTGLAVLRALQNANVSIDASIYNYLPTFWTKSRSISGITFKQLLNHTSGFRASSGTTTFGYDYDGLRAMIAAGINTANKTYEYENINYALARIVCVYLDNYLESGVTDHAKATSDHFDAFVQKYVMDPCGAPDVDWQPDAVEPTIFYPNPIGSSTGTTYGDWSLRAGSAGCHISIAELNIMLERLYASTTIIGSTKRTEMNTYKLGWDGSTTVKHGLFYRKGGYFPGGAKTGGGVWNGGAELHAYVAQFDNGIQVSAVINDYIGIDIKDAYDKAWAPKLISIKSVTAGIENVSTESLLVQGQNLDIVTAAVYDLRKSITSTDASDPTQAYIQPLSSTALLVHLPQGMQPGSYNLYLSSGLVLSNSVPYQVTRPRGATLVCSTAPKAGNNFRVVISAGSLQVPFAWLALSPSDAPSKIPGVFDFELGNSFQLLVFWPLSQKIDAQTSATTFDLPSIPSLRRERWFVQGLFPTTLPLATTNLGTLVFR